MFPSPQQVGSSKLDGEETVKEPEAVTQTASDSSQQVQWLNPKEKYKKPT